MYDLTNDNLDTDALLGGNDAPLSSELAPSMLASALDEIAERLRGQKTVKEWDESSNTSSLGEFAQKLLNWRSSIDNAFGFRGLSASPGWCILLDLFAASEQGRLLTVSDASMSGGTAPTTGLRWVHVLEQKGLIARENDQADARRVYLRLKDDTETRISDLLSSLHD